MTRTPKRNPKKTNKIMTLTSYTKYCLEAGDKLKVFISGNPNKTQKQLAAMRNCYAEYDGARKLWYVIMTADDYKAKSACLKGLKMEFFTKVA